MNMDAALGTLADDVGLVVKEPLGNTGPVAEITHQLEVRESVNHAGRDPRVLQDAAPMCLVPDWDACLPLDLQHLLEELLALALAPRVPVSVAADQPRFERFPGLDLLLERRDMLFEGVSGCQDLEDVLESVFVEEAPKAIAGLGVGRQRIDPVVACGLELGEGLLPGLTHSPQVAHHAQFHWSLLGREGWVYHGVGKHLALLVVM